MKKIVAVISVFLIQIPFIYSQCDEYKENIPDVVDFSNEAYNFGNIAYTFAGKAQSTDKFDSAKIYIDSVKVYLEKTYLSADDAKTSAFNAKTAAYDCECSEGQVLASRLEQDCDDAAHFAKKAKKIVIKAQKSIDITGLKDKIRDAKKLILKSYNISYDVKTNAEKGVKDCD